jgi:hypothetical protein
MNACVDLALDDTTDFIVNAGRYQYVSLCPWLVRNGQYFYWQKEVFAEVPSL